MKPDKPHLYKVVMYRDGVEVPSSTVKTGNYGDCIFARRNLNLKPRAFGVLWEVKPL